MTTQNSATAFKHSIVEVLSPDGTREPIHLTYGAVPRWPLEVKFADGTRREYKQWSLWHNVLKLRDELENEGKRLLCVASRPNSVVSGMLLDMSGGAVVYQVPLGQEARLEDRIGLLQPAAPEEVGTVTEQLAFKEKWSQSLRKQNGN